LAEEAGDNWSRREVDAIVRLYVDMLGRDTRGEKMNKSALYRETAAAHLPARNVKSVERKLQNISAVMEDLGLPRVSGLAPLRKIQGILTDAVREALGHQELEEAVSRAVSLAREDRGVYLDDVDSLVVDPTEARLQPYKQLNDVRHFDWNDAERRRIGLLGEEWVVQVEQARLSKAGQPSLAGQVTHTAKVDGDGAGYDIHSFEADGRDRLIEVKTTASGPGRSFHVTRNELEVSKQRADAFWLYRVFDFWSTPRMYQLAGAMDQTLQLDPRVFAALPKL